MKEFVEKLIGRLEEEKKYCSYHPHTRDEAINKAIKIANQLAEEYNNGFCEWKGIHMFGLYNSSCQQKSIVNPSWTYCPYCGKKIKVVD